MSVTLRIFTPGAQWYLLTIAGVATLVYYLSISYTVNPKIYWGSMTLMRNPKCGKFANPLHYLDKYLNVAAISEPRLCMFFSLGVMHCVHFAVGLCLFCFGSWFMCHVWHCVLYTSAGMCDIVEMVTNSWVWLLF